MNINVCEAQASFGCQICLRTILPGDSMSLIGDEAACERCTHDHMSLEAS